MQQALVWTYGIYILWGHPVVISYFPWLNLVHTLPTYSRDMTKISRSKVNAVLLICGKKSLVWTINCPLGPYLAHTSLIFKSEVNKSSFNPYYVMQFMVTILRSKGHHMHVDNVYRFLWQIMITGSCWDWIWIEEE